MGPAATRALWSTVLAVGCAGVAVALLMGVSGSARPAAVRPIDPGAPARLATEPPRPGVSAPAPSTTKTPAPSLDRGARPISVRIAAIGVAAPVVAVGVDRRGAVAVPERVDTVGWYRFSAPAGSGTGSTVLVGHVDSAEQGTGAFFRLRDLERDDRIVVTVAGGRSVAYRVVSRALFPKASAPLQQMFALTGAPRLTLITCGGSFDAAQRSYRDNVVVTALPI